MSLVHLSRSLTCSSSHRFQLGSSWKYPFCPSPVFQCTDISRTEQGAAPRGRDVTSQMIFSSFSRCVFSPMVYSKVTVAHCSPDAFFSPFGVFLGRKRGTLGPLTFFMRETSMPFSLVSLVRFGLAQLQTRLFPCLRLVISDSLSIFHGDRPRFYTWFNRFTPVF